MVFYVSKKQSTSSLLWLVTLGSIFVIGLGLAFFQYMLHDLPRLDSIQDYRPPLVSRALDAEGNVVAEFYTEKRTLVSAKQLPKHVIYAFLAAEDANFYTHEGIDYLGIVRAILNEMKYRVIGGQRLGGSTITQQTAKTMLLTRQRTYIRKLKEFILAKRIEDSLSKDEILNLYLNQIYFGNGAYGIEEAAQTYYGVSAKDLTLAQAASLAGIPKSPNKINPIKDPARVKTRRDYVLEQMVVHGFASEKTILKAKLEPVQVRTTRQFALNLAPYYAEEIRRILIDSFGEDQVYHGGLTIHTPINLRLQIAAQTALSQGLRTIDKRQGYRGPVFKINKDLLGKLNEKRKNLFENTNRSAVMWNLSEIEISPDLIRVKNLRPGEITAGLVKSVSNPQSASIDLGTVTATLPMSKMTWARPFNPESYTPIPKIPSQVLKVGDVVWVRIDKAGPQVEVGLEQQPLVEGALAAIEPHSHRVLAMVGGYNFFTSSFNRATQAKRQPGSSFKPFIYATAIDKQLVTAATLITDAPKVFFDNSGENQWKPRNNTRKFLGDITVHACLTQSVNTCSISLIEKAGIDAIRDLASQVGLITDKTPFPRDLTLALGTGEVIPLHHFNAFSIFPNGGQYAAPVLIEKVLSKEGSVLFEAKTQNKQVISPQGAYVMTNLLRGPMRSFGRSTTGLTDPLAGKTGTTNDFRSAWFVGFSQDLVAGVYVGFDNNQSLGMGEYGAKAALPTWGNFMREALKVIPAREFVQPEDIVWKLIDPKTGLLATSNATYDPNAQNPDEIDESQVTTAEVASATPVNKVVMEAFIKGTEPTKSTSEGAPTPLELLDMGSN